MKKLRNRTQKLIPGFSLTLLVEIMDVYNHFYDSDEDLIEAFEAYEDGELADRALELYQLREEQREFQRGLIEQTGGSIQPDQPGRFVFELRPLQRRQNRRYSVGERNYEIQLGQEGNVVDRVVPGIQNALHRAVQRILDDDQLPNNHRLFVDVFSHRLAHGAYRRNGLTVGDWCHHPERVDQVFNGMQNALNSNEDFRMDDTFHLEVTTVAPSLRRERGRRPRQKKAVYLGIQDFLTKNKSIVKIQNKDSNCLARTLTAVKGAADYPVGHPMRRKLMKTEKTVSDVHQKAADVALHQAAGVPLETACGADEIRAFQEVLPQYRIICIYTGRNHEAVAFAPYDPQKKELVIVHVDGHYHGCTSLKNYRQNVYVCPYCLQGFNHAGQHSCPSLDNNTFCKRCKHDGCPDYVRAKPQGLEPKMRCKDCGCAFYGKQCYRYHLTHAMDGKINPDNSVCHNIRRCIRCKRLNRSKQAQKEHRCGFATCPTCKDYVKLQTHRCFIESGQKIRKKRKADSAAKKAAKKAKTAAEEMVDDFMEEETRPRPKEEPEPIECYFDIEARQEDGNHVANLLICQDSVGGEFIFRGENCVEDFIKHLKKQCQNTKRPITAIAHNVQSYDGYFVINELYRDGKEVKQIRNGAKLLEIEHYDIRFIDSLHFFAMPLKHFPATFGLSYQDDSGEELYYAKGYFPHLFNTRENQQYVGSLPAKKFYMPQTMGIEDLKAFETWHKQQTDAGAIFDFQRDIVAYCQMDVRILREGCQTFQRLFKQETTIYDEAGQIITPGFNPFSHITIASACNRDMVNRLPEETIATEPAYGWAGRKGNQSKQGYEWLLWLEHEAKKNVGVEELEQLDAMGVPEQERDYFIQHVGNGGEHEVPWVGKVDGFNPKKNIAYEFNGCFWHGCTTCYPNRTELHTRLDNRAMWEAREVTAEKKRKLESLGITVIDMWSCEWEKKKKNNPELKAFIDNLEFTDRLDPRLSFFGGRTNAAALYHQCQDGEEIHYYDFTSLYPFCNKYAEYPTGHPQVILNPEDQDISSYFGVAQCIVRPPRHLYHPVLPVHLDGKLIFPLCVKCAQDNLPCSLHDRTWVCPHSDVDREMIGTWCMPELEEAKRQGYDIVKILEVYHFPENQRKVGLFAEYINKWYKIKTKASGWPKWCDDEEKKAAYIRSFKQRENIDLSWEQLDKGENKGLRSLAKLMLNSMWGKFGQRPNKTQCVHFTDLQVFHEFLESDKYLIHKIQLLLDKNDPTKTSEDGLDVFFSLKEVDMEINAKSNIFVAAFTTCWARLKLYAELDKVQEQILYYDTDSILLRIDPNNPHHYRPQTGDYLGDLTDELYDKKKKQCHFITEFASAGPKNYGYVMDNQKEECKVKEFSLNAEGSKKLNYQILRNNVLDEIQQPLYNAKTGQLERRKYPVKRTYRIVRDATKFQLHTKSETKNYQLVYDKRVVDPLTFQTYPYGYGELDNQQMEVDINTLLDL